MQIPIQNIYYLLCYAWNKLDAADRVKISIEDRINLLDLFAEVLKNATRQLLKRGIDRSYIEIQDEFPGVKGKLLMTESLKRDVFSKQRTICLFDEFSANILINRILVTTLERLNRTKGLDKDLKRDIMLIRRMLFNIDSIELKPALFKRIRLNRNNQFYGFVLHVCEIIYENTLPTENPGELFFVDFMRNKDKMNKLFESFILNFYKLRQQEFSIVKSEIIDWKLKPINDEDGQYLPNMKTDITLRNKQRKIIIDAKFYRQTLSTNYDTEKITSYNLYQLFSYLLNQEDKADATTMNTEGILVYPTIEQEYDLAYRYANHTITVRTLNLNTDWRNIEARLQAIIM